jgi:hypothetical protein
MEADDSFGESGPVPPDGSRATKRSPGVWPRGTGYVYTRLVTKIIHVPDVQLVPYGYTQIGPGV